jgi:hypothetical protein
MRWFAGIAIGYLALMLIAFGAIQFLARANRQPATEYRGPTGEYVLRLYRDAPIPAFFGAHGDAPGELEVDDSAGRVMDSEHVPDVDNVGDIQWERYKVDFQYRDGAQTYRGALNLAQ